MKNLFLTVFAFLMIGLASCGDNIDFSKEHILTDEEIAEMARQDSIAKAEKERINANLVLNYTVDINIGKTAYDGAMLAIETDKIAELFGITKEQLLAGIAGEAGAPEVKGFAIEWTTRADVGSATNTNSPWGHWWDIDGNVTTWGADAMVFAEFNTEVGEFHVGQYPGHLTDGDTIRFIECLKYNEKRAAVVITVLAHTPGQITAQVVNTQNLTINITPKTDYTQDSLEFDLTKTLSDLGVASMSGVKFLGVNKDGSYSQETTTKNGFWYDLEGFVGSWGDNASVFTSYDDGMMPNKIGVGQMPNKLAEGQSYTVKYGFLANNKIEMLQIKVNVVGYVDPETPPTGSPTTVTKDISLSKPYSDDYASIRVDLKDILRDAFKMTTYQIHKSIASGELKVFLNEVPNPVAAPSYTADVPGYWIKADGTPGAWAESLVWCSIGHSNSDLYLFGGNHPENAVAGNTVTTKMIIVCNGGQVTLNITFKLT